MKKRALSLILALVMCLGLLPATTLAVGRTYKAGDQLSNGFIIPYYVQGEIEEEKLFTQYVGNLDPKSDQDDWYALIADQVEFDFGDILVEDYSWDVIERSTIVRVTNVGSKDIQLPMYQWGENPTDIKAFVDYAYSLDEKTLVPGASARLQIGFKLCSQYRGWGYGKGRVKGSLVGNVPLSAPYTFTYNLVEPEKTPPEEKPEEPQQVTVSFLSDGGSSVPNKTVTVGEPYGSLPTPTREGYSFDGWYAYGKRVTSSTIVTDTSDHILYAEWSRAEPEKETVIENGVLLEYGGNERNVVIPNGVKQIGENVFKDNTDIVSVTIPGGVTEIGNSAFWGCTNLTSVTIPASMTSIQNNAFRDCKNLTHVTIPDSVTRIGYAAFYGCSSLTGLTLPLNLTGLGGCAFEGCTGLTSVTIPGGVYAINSGAFRDCTGLKTVVIQEGVKGVDVGAFENCTSLTSVSIPGNIGEWNGYTGLNSYAFEGCTNLKTIYGVPGSEAEDYANAQNINFVPIDGSAPTEQPVTPGKPETAMPTNDKLTVNGVLANPTVYKIGGSNYFKIRDVAALLNGTEKQFSVGYDGALKSVTATTGEGYAKLDTDLVGAPAGGNKTANPSNDTIYVNGVKIDAEVYKIDGGNYFKLRDLGKALNFGVGWAREIGVMIDTGRPYTE